MNLRERIESARQSIADRWPGQPKVGIILGTGLGGLAQQIEVEKTISYAEIPHFPESTVISHAGKLVCGTLEGVTVVAMEGRFHFYERYSLPDITFPVRVIKALGADTLFVSNACGGMNHQYRLGDLMAIEDHINLMGDNPLIGPNDESLGPRFPDMSQPYDFELIAKAQEIALEEKISLQKGVYVAVPGPNLETRAEYRFLKALGADVVGMSTVPEVIVAVHAGLKVFGVSIITDLCLPDALEPVAVEKIIAVAGAAEPKLTTLFRRMVKECG